MLPAMIRNMTLKKVLLLALHCQLALRRTRLCAEHPRDAQERACGRDVSRFCKAVMDAGDMVILSCLQQNRTKISPACQKVLKDNGV